MSGSFTSPESTPNAAGGDILASLEAYWQSLRHAQQLPARHDLVPHQIDLALPHAFILHRVAPGVARIRMAGQRIHDLLRMDARGLPFSILFASASRDQLCDLVETAFTRPAIVAADLSAPARMLRAPLRARLLMLPLADTRGDTSRILGGIVTDGQAGQQPARFDLAADCDLRIDSLAIAQKPDAGRPALRLVVNNG